MLIPDWVCCIVRHGRSHNHSSLYRRPQNNESVERVTEFDHGMGTGTANTPHATVARRPCPRRQHSDRETGRGSGGGGMAVVFIRPEATALVIGWLKFIDGSSVFKFQRRDTYFEANSLTLPGYITPTFRRMLFLFQSAW